MEREEKKQLMMNCSRCMAWRGFNKEEIIQALKYFMYLKEKIDGRIKGRGCADRRPQQEYTKKIDTSSPTALLAAIMLTYMIDAFKKRDVATFTIQGAFLQTNMPKGEDDVHVILDGQLVELLAKSLPETYQKYFHQRQGQAYSYCHVNVAIYGTLRAAFLF